MTPTCRASIDELVGMRFEDAVAVASGAVDGASAATALLGYRVRVYANNAQAVEIKVKDFRASLFLAKDKTLTIYVDDGRWAIATLPARNFVIKDNAELKNIESLIINYYEKGFVPCAECGSDVLHVQARLTGRTIHAAAYCEECAATDKFKLDKSREGS